MPNETKRRRRTSVSVYAEVDLAEIDTADLQDELTDRLGKAPDADPAEAKEAFEELRLAFYMRDEARALRLARELCEMVTGRVLP